MNTRGTPEMISYSEIAAFLRCRYRWSLEWHRRIEPKVKPFLLLRGCLVHEVFAEGWRLFLRGEYSREVLEAVAPQAIRQSKEGPEADEELVRECVRIGVLAFECVQAHNYEVVELEGRPLVEERMYTPSGVDGVLFSFKPDAVIRRLADGAVLLLDLKTRKSISSDPYLMHDLQASLYTEALRRVGVDVDAAVHLDVLCTTPRPPKRLKNGGLSTAKAQIISRETVEQAVQDCAAEGIEIPEKDVTKLMAIADSREWHKWIEMRMTAQGRAQAWRTMQAVVRERPRYSVGGQVDPCQLLAYDSGPLGCRGCPFNAWCDSLIAHGGREPVALLGVSYDAPSKEMARHTQSIAEGAAAIEDLFARALGTGRFEK